MKSLLSLLLVFMSFTVWGQRSMFDSYPHDCNDSLFFEPDSVSKISYGQVEGLDKIFKPDEDVLFEFRLYSEAMLIQSQSVFIMLLTKDKQWHTRYFAHRDSLGALTADLRECKIIGSKPNALWCILLNLKVLSTPDHAVIKPRLVQYQFDTTELPYGSRRITDITDGIRYNFILRSGHLERSYSYSNPRTYQQHFKNVEELYNVCSIIAVIRKYIGLPLTDY